MRAVIFSDIHGNQYAFQAFIEEIQRLDYELLFFCGDIYGYYYGQDEIVQGFKQLKNLYAVKGNHDEMAIQISEGTLEVSSEILGEYGHSYCMLSKEGINYVRKFPDKVELTVDGKRVLIVHGTVEDRLNGRLYPTDEAEASVLYQNYDYVFCGHTHYRMVKKKSNTIILNPGSLGQQRDGMGFGYVFMDFKTGEYEFRNVRLKLDELEREIDLYDQGNVKLKQVLYRGGY